MRSIFSKWKQVFTVTLLAMALPLSAVAQAYPSKPIKMIVPFPAGGTTDIVARIIAQKMTESMGQPVTVDNKGGAGGNIGADLMAKAAPDGYTIMMHNLSFPLAAVAQALANRSPFNVDTDFAGVSIAVYVPFIWTSSPSVPAKDLKELANLLKSNKSLQYNYGSTGPGSTMHVLGELLAGRLQVGGDQLSSSLAEVKAGTLKALATTASKRIPGLPDVPTVKELGYPNLELEGWNGVFAPAKTPKDIIDRLNKEVIAAVRHPDVVKRLNELGAEGVGSTPAAQDAMLRKQMDQFRGIIREMKLD